MYSTNWRQIMTIKLFVYGVFFIFIFSLCMQLFMIFKLDLPYWFFIVIVIADILVTMMASLCVIGRNEIVNIMKGK